MVTTVDRITELEAAVRAVPDPEIPVITLDDLGVIRSFEADLDTGVVRVVMTPTYSGCPAMEAMTTAVASAIERRGCTPQVEIALQHPKVTLIANALGTPPADMIDLERRLGDL